MRLPSLSRSRALIVAGLATAVFLVGAAWVGAARGISQHPETGDQAARQVRPHSNKKRHGHSAPTKPPPAVNTTGPGTWTPEQMANAKPATPGVAG